jgi:aspartate aminotransferase-like enzyme
VALSERAEGRAAGVAHRGFYTDLLRYVDRHRAGGTITTPAMAQIHAARVGLRRVLEEGMEARWRRHAELRRRVAAWAAAHDLADATAPDAASPTVSCLRPPPGTAAPEVVRSLAERGFTVAGGYGAWKAETFRIGHMGEVTVADLDALLAALGEVLHDVLHEVRAGRRDPVSVPA